MTSIGMWLKVNTVKATLLLSLLPRRPREFYDRIVHFATVRRGRTELPKESYISQEWPQLLSELGQELRVDLDALSRESVLAEFRQEISRRTDYISNLPFSRLHTADVDLGLLCYLVCRSFRPAQVVETGVAYGLTSAFILKALEVNGRGALDSIDLPPLTRNADRYVGLLVPNRLRHRWTLHRGTSQRLLPGLLKRLGGTDVFVHDSLHTEQNMTAEFEIAARYLHKPGVLISDDINLNSAWRKWTAGRQNPFTAVVRESEKENLFGICVVR